MQYFLRPYALVTLFILTLACTAGAPRIGRMPVGIATIVNSGSTNTAGFTVRVFPNGKAIVALSRPASTRVGWVGRKAASNLFAAIHASQSNGRPSGAAMCMKSASFGTTMRIQYGGWASVDLNCPVVGANAELKTRADAIVVALKIQTSMMSRPVTLPIGEPRRDEHPPIQGSGQPSPPPVP